MVLSTSFRTRIFINVVHFENCAADGASEVVVVLVDWAVHRAAAAPGDATAMFSCRTWAIA